MNNEIEKYLAMMQIQNHYLFSLICPHSPGVCVSSIRKTFYIFPIMVLYLCYRSIYELLLTLPLNSEDENIC